MQKKSTLSILSKTATFIISATLLVSCDGFFSNFTLPSRGIKVNVPNGSSGSGASSSEIVDRGLYNAIIARNGDTMQSLAARAGVSADALASNNGVSLSYTPRDGQEFVIPGSSKASVAAPDPVTKEPETKSVTHTIRSGETIYSIARLYGVSVTRLAAANSNIGADLVVNEGQVITIPAEGTEIVSTPAPTPTPAEPAPTTTTDNSRFSAPVSGTIETPYNPASGSDGYVYSTSAKAPVKAANAGEVVLISESTGANGTIVMLKHSNGMISVYGRLGSVNVTKGQSVSAGQTIGTTAGSQLLFQLREGTASVDPARHLS